MAHIRHGHLYRLAGFVAKCLLAEQVDVQQGSVLLPYRHHAGADAGAKPGFQFFQNFVVVGVLQVGFIYKHHAAFACFLRQMKGFFRPHGYAGTGGNNHQHTVCCQNALLHPQAKIKQSGGIQQVQLGGVVLHRGQAQCQAGLAFLLLRVKVANGGAILYGTGPLHLRVSAVQQCFHQRGFATACVACYQNIANVIAWIAHKKQSPLSFALLKFIRLKRHLLQKYYHSNLNF